MREIETDVLVVGTGVAGVMAAVRAARMRCRVVLASKGAMGSGNSVLAGGGWLVPSKDFSPDEYVDFVLDTGKRINDAKLVRVLAQRGEAVVEMLRGMSLPLKRRGKRSWYIERGISKRFPGIVLMQTLLEQTKNEWILGFPSLTVIELLMHERRVSGAIGISKNEGRVVIDAKSVVLATGGAGGIYRRHDNHRRIKGDGYWLALQVGLPLRDMEFVQCYPLALAEPHLPPIIITSPFPKEAKTINSKGEDVMKKHGLPLDLSECILQYRDQFTLAVTREMGKGKVYLDYMQIPRKNWEKPPLNRLARLNPDFRNRPFSIAPVAHFFMGGVEIDEYAQTSIPGLFAAGEVTAGVHGANRVGGNALLDCAVFGDRAGESAARYAMGARRGRPKQELFRGSFPWKEETKGARELFHDVQDLTWTHAGPIRNAKSLREGLSGISEMEEKLSELEAAGKSFDLNEVKGSLLISKAIMRASWEREESRGAFYREDFPDMNDKHWLKNILLRLDHETGDFIVSHKPIERL